ncbi:HNH endonuclease family protein [Streptomyces sp. t39]|uniref:HNH endonuclease family protein n=1 Tax=Streptomyces sp. t39 TaxID=1828156 RepID=UPI0011CE9BF7|nr:HNH endonuclease family protein [Streptomyces sp. t39]TXS52757.1 HNH endonuclease [Streptomyces sp. t39]
MITNLVRGLTALTLALAPLTTAAPAQALETVPLADAVELLPVVVEERTGYTRTSFKHWNSGDDAGDGCNTRAEVLIAEATVAPEVGPGCAISGGSWTSYYDGQTVTVAGSLDIDHMVPLAEAWDSGASSWTPARREAYANDQGAATSLVAVTARSNRAKADRDPAEWLPPAADVHCRYIGEWVGTKLRWGLAIDEAELATLEVYGETCETTVVNYTAAP